MLKNYLRVLPKGVQISIFFGLWIALFLIGSMLSSIIQAQYTTESIQDASLALFANPQLTILLNAVLQVFMFGIPAVLFSYLADPELKRYLGFRKERKILSPVVLFLLAALLIFFVSSIAGLVKTIDLGDLANQLQGSRDQQINSYLRSSSLAGVLVAILGMAVIPAVCEELFFRGVFMKIMLNVNKKPWAAFVFTSFFFTVLHSSVYEFVPIFAASMVLCFLYFYTGNIVNNIMVHFLNNAIQVILVLFVDDSNQVATSNMDKLMLVGILLATSVGLYLILHQVYKNKNITPSDWNMQYIPTGGIPK